MTVFCSIEVLRSVKFKRGDNRKRTEIEHFAYDFFEFVVAYDACSAMVRMGVTMVMRLMFSPPMFSTCVRKGISG